MELGISAKSMRLAVIDVEKASYPVRMLCRAFRVSKSGLV